MPHLHLSRTLSPTSLWVGATISRIFRHPNRSEKNCHFYVKSEIGFVGKSLIMFPHSTYLNFWIITRLGTGSSNCSSWYYFLFPPPIDNIFIPMSRLEKIPLDFFSVSQIPEWYRHPLIFYAVVLFCQLFMHWVLIDILDVKTLPDNEYEESKSTLFLGESLN